MLFTACESTIFSENELAIAEKQLQDKLQALQMKEYTSDDLLLIKDSVMLSTNSSPDIFLTEQEIKEGMEWWKNRSGTLPALYEYSVNVQDFPVNECPDLYEHYINITWNCYPPITQSIWQDYSRMQVFFRVTYDPFDSWYYWGEDRFPGDYNYGIVSINRFQEQLSLNAEHFPYGNIQIKYRLLHKNFPGKADKTDEKNEDTWYDKSLATAWYYDQYHNQPSYYNMYGFGFSDLEDYGSIKFIISCGVPIRYMSITMDNAVTYYPKRINGEYTITIPKNKEQGSFVISVTPVVGSTVFRSDSYDNITPNERHYSFTENDFN